MDVLSTKIAESANSKCSVEAFWIIQNTHRLARVCKAKHCHRVHRAFLHIAQDCPCFFPDSIGRPNQRMHREAQARDLTAGHQSPALRRFLPFRWLPEAQVRVVVQNIGYMQGTCSVCSRYTVKINQSFFPEPSAVVSKVLR